MAVAGSVASESVSVCAAVIDAVDACRALRVAGAEVDVSACQLHELRVLTAGLRDGQQAIDALLMRVGAAADTLHEQGVDPVGVLLGDGSGVRGHTARREVERARTAAGLARVGAAVAGGLIGAPQVDAITNAAKNLTPDQRQQLDSAEIVAAAVSLPVDTFARKVRDEAERIRGDYGLADTLAKQARSCWKHWMDPRSGMGRISGEFDPERYEAVITAVDSHVTRLANTGGVSKTSNLAATAAFELLTGRATASSGVPHVSVVVDADTLTGGAHEHSLRETAGGSPLPPDSIARLACDAVLQRVVVDQHRIPVNVGRKHRTATAGQWHGLRAMYRSCAWAGCDRPLAWCQAHHIHEWDHGGRTDLCNLIPLCSRHHHAVHEGGWTVKLTPDTRRLDIHRPDRTLFATTYPDRPVPGGAARRRTGHRTGAGGRSAEPGEPARSGR